MRTDITSDELEINNPRAGTPAARGAFASLGQAVRKKSDGSDDGSSTAQNIRTELFTSDTEQVEETTIEQQNPSEQISGYAIKVRTDAKRRQTHALSMLAAGEEAQLNRTKAQMAANIAAVTTAERNLNTRKTFRKYSQINPTETDKQTEQKQAVLPTETTIKTERKYAINIGHLHTDAAGHIKRQTAAVVAGSEQQTTQRVAKISSVWKYFASEDKTQVDVGLANGGMQTASASRKTKDITEPSQPRSTLATSNLRSGNTSFANASKMDNVKVDVGTFASDIKPHMAHQPTRPQRPARGAQEPASPQRTEPASKPGTALRVTTAPVTHNQQRSLEPQRPQQRSEQRNDQRALPRIEQRVEPRVEPRNQTRIEPRAVQPAIPQTVTPRDVQPRSVQPVVPPQTTLPRETQPREVAPRDIAPRDVTPRDAQPRVIPPAASDRIEAPRGEQRPIIIPSVPEQPPVRRGYSGYTTAPETPRGTLPNVGTPQTLRPDNRVIPPVATAPEHFSMPRDRITNDRSTIPGGIISSENFIPPSAVVFLSQKVQIDIPKDFVSPGTVNNTPPAQVASPPAAPPVVQPEPAKPDAQAAVPAPVEPQRPETNRRVASIAVPAGPMVG